MGKKKNKKKQKPKNPRTNEFQVQSEVLEDNNQQTKPRKKSKIKEFLQGWIINQIKNPIPLISLIFTILIFAVGSRYSNSMNNVKLKLTGTQMNKIVNGDEGFSLNPYIAFKLKRLPSSGQPENFYLGKFEDDTMSIREIRVIDTLPVEDEEFSKINAVFSSPNEKKLTNIAATIQKPKFMNQFKPLSEKQKVGFKSDNYKNADFVLYIYDPGYTLSMSKYNKTSYLGYYHLISKGKNGSFQVLTFIHKQSGKEDDFEDITESYLGLEIFDETKWEKSNFKSIKNEVVTSYQKTLEFVKSNSL